VASICAGFRISSGLKPRVTDGTKSAFADWASISSRDGGCWRGGSVAGAGGFSMLIQAKKIQDPIEEDFATAQV
jgi:hypothetical protein